MQLMLIIVCFIIFTYILRNTNIIKLSKKYTSENFVVAVKDKQKVGTSYLDDNNIQPKSTWKQNNINYETCYNTETRKGNTTGRYGDFYCEQGIDSGEIIPSDGLYTLDFSNYNVHAGKEIIGKKLNGTYTIPSGKTYNLNNDGTVINQILTLKESKEFCDALKNKCIGFMISIPTKGNYDKKTIFISSLDDGWEDPDTYNKKENSNNNIYTNVISYIKKDPSKNEKPIEQELINKLSKKYIGEEDIKLVKSEMVGTDTSVKQQFICDENENDILTQADIRAGGWMDGITLKCSSGKSKTFGGQGGGPAGSTNLGTSINVHEYSQFLSKINNVGGAWVSKNKDISCPSGKLKGMEVGGDMYIQNITLLCGDDSKTSIDKCDTTTNVPGTNRTCGSWAWENTLYQHGMGLPRNVNPVFPADVCWDGKHCVDRETIKKRAAENKKEDNYFIPLFNKDKNEQTGKDGVYKVDIRNGNIYPCYDISPGKYMNGGNFGVVLDNDISTGVDIEKYHAAGPMLPYIIVITLPIEKPFIGTFKLDLLSPWGGHTLPKKISLVSYSNNAFSKVWWNSVYTNDDEPHRLEIKDLGEVGNGSSTGPFNYSWNINFSKPFKHIALLIHSGWNQNGNVESKPGAIWINSLTFLNSDSKTTQIQPEPKVIVYHDYNYQGGGLELGGAGTYDYNFLAAKGLNDRISSIKVPKGFKVVAWEHANRGGRSKTYTSDAQWVGDDFNDVISHIEVYNESDNISDISIPNIELRYGNRKLYYYSNANFPYSNSSLEGLNRYIVKSWGFGEYAQRDLAPMSTVLSHYGPNPPYLYGNNWESAWWCWTQSYNGGSNDSLLIEFDKPRNITSVVAKNWDTYGNENAGDLEVLTVLKMSNNQIIDVKSLGTINLRNSNKILGTLNLNQQPYKNLLFLRKNVTGWSKLENIAIT